MTEQVFSDPFPDLDRTALETWAGVKTLSRGRQYQREGRVEDMVRSPAGTLIAWVEGTERYATAVLWNESLFSICTCPVGSACKHAVAVILEYLAVRKENEPVRILPADDLRLSILGLGKEQNPAADPEVSPTGPKPGGGQDTGNSRKRTNRKPVSLHRYLEDLSKEELIGLLDDLIRVYPAVKQEITDRRSVADSDAGSLLSVLLSDIDRITAGDAWNNSWNSEFRIPDFSPVRKRMEILLLMDAPDAVVRAGQVLFKKGMDQIERSNDEGALAEEIASCMNLVFQALVESSLPACERMLFAILADLDDDFDLCAGAEKFWEGRFQERDWGLVADALIPRLGEGKYDPKNRNSGSRHYRDKLAGWIMTALDNAGREEEATDLCVAEAGRTESYVRLVRRLLRLGRSDEAREWIARGTACTGTTFPGIAAELRTIRRELWEKEGDWLSAAGERAEEFLLDPSFSSYRHFESSVKKAGIWESVKGYVLQYLADGKVPVLRKDLKKTAMLFGCLPETGLTDRKSWKTRGAPFYEVLIDIAVAEKRPDDVIAWYDRYRKQPPVRGSWYLPDDKVAAAVAEKYPDRALGIWKGRTERLVAEARPKSYESAIGYLRKIHNLMKKQGREEQWDQYIGQMRTGNARKTRFLEMLDALEGKKILKS